jgi:hypothetical protein
LEIAKQKSHEIVEQVTCPQVDRKCEQNNAVSAALTSSPSGLGLSVSVNAPQTFFKLRIAAPGFTPPTPEAPFDGSRVSSGLIMIFPYESLRNPLQALWLISQRIRLM